MFTSNQPNTVGRETKCYWTLKYNVITCTHVCVLYHLISYVNEGPKMQKTKGLKLGCILSK